LISKQKKQSFKRFLFLSLLFGSNLASFFLLIGRFPLFIICSYGIASISIFLLYSKHERAMNVLSLEYEEKSERLNLLQEDVQKKQALMAALDKKKIRYKSLDAVVNIFNKNIVLEKLGQTIVDETFALFGGVGNVLLYLLGPKNTLVVSFSKKIDPSVVIREKKGDMFDEWVLRHNQSLLSEDVSRDFRFDSETLKKSISRDIGSVIIAPLKTAHRFLGIVRVETNFAGLFSSEDLRFLSTVSHLSSMALENSFLYEHTEELAIKDGLTGLYLRRFLNERGKEELVYAGRSGYEVSVIMIDIDHFKVFNDKFGHRSGDIVLMHIASLLKKMFADKGFLMSRFGGEEFLVLLPKVKKQEAVTIGESIRAAVEAKKLILRRTPAKNSVSIGVASYPHDADNWIELIRMSDEAMYKAKQLGRNKVCAI